MLGFGLNQVTMSEASFEDFLGTAARLGCVGVELRNDLGRPVFDGMTATEVRGRLRDHGLRLLGLSQIYPFNRWSAEIAHETRALIDTARDAGAETVSLIPCNDGTGTDEVTRSDDLSRALESCLPMLQEAGMVALIEPLGFARSSLRQKSELVAAIDALEAGEWFKLVHDTFHHALAGAGPIYPERTGIVHISGVSDGTLPFERLEDDHRLLIDGQDRLDNLGQIAAFIEAGYSGAFSFECFAPEVRSLADHTSALARSIEFISSNTQQRAA